MRPDPHDPRLFRHFVKVVDQTVVAVVEVAAGAQAPTDGEGSNYVDVTDLPRADYHGVVVAGETDAAIRTELAARGG